MDWNFHKQNSHLLERQGGGHAPPPPLGNNVQTGACFFADLFKNLKPKPKCLELPQSPKNTFHSLGPIPVANLELAVVQPHSGVTAKPRAEVWDEQVDGGDPEGSGACDVTGVQQRTSYSYWTLKRPGNRDNRTNAIVLSPKSICLNFIISDIQDASNYFRTNASSFFLDCMQHHAGERCSRKQNPGSRV